MIHFLLIHPAAVIVLAIIAAIVLAIGVVRLLRSPIRDVTYRTRRKVYVR